MPTLSFVLNSVRAGQLLPYLQYQLYVKQKGPIFPGIILRQNSEAAGPSHGMLQPNVHQNLHPPQHNVPRAVMSQSSFSYQNNANPNPSNSKPQSVPHSCAPRFSSEPTHLASSHVNKAPKHRSPLQTHAVCDPSPMKPPQSTIQAPHPNLRHQKVGQKLSQTNTHHGGCKQVESL